MITAMLSSILAIVCNVTIINSGSSCGSRNAANGLCSYGTNCSNRGKKSTHTLRTLSRTKINIFSPKNCWLIQRFVCRCSDSSACFKNHRLFHVPFSRIWRQIKCILKNKHKLTESTEADGLSASQWIIHLMSQPHGSLPSSQQPATGPYSE